MYTKSFFHTIPCLSSVATSSICAKMDEKSGDIHRDGAMNHRWKMESGRERRRGGNGKAFLLEG